MHRLMESGNLTNGLFEPNWGSDAAHIGYGYRYRPAPWGARDPRPGERRSILSWGHLSCNALVSGLTSSTAIGVDAVDIDVKEGERPATEPVAALAKARLPRWTMVEAGLRRRLVNIGHLLSGNGFTGAVTLVTVVLTAGSLGPADYGILALIVSYVRLFDRLMRFESWQPLIKYAAESGHPPEAQRERLRALFAFGLWLDGAACVAAAATAVLVLWLFSPLFGMSEANVVLVLIHCTSLLFNISGMPTAVLRLAGRFRTIAYMQVLGSLLRLLLCGIGLWWEGGLLFFIVAWTASQILSSVLFLVLALFELRRQEVKALHRVPLRGITGRFPGIMNFAWSSSLSMSLRTSSMELDVLLVGALADAKSAGLYFVAKQIAKIVQQVCGQVQAVLYPDIARLWAERSFGDFRRATVQVQLILDTFALTGLAALMLSGPAIIATLMGPAFGQAFPLLVVQMIAVVFTMHAAPLRSALLAMGEQRAVLRIVLAATLIFHGLALTLIPIAGAMGANIAHVALAAVCAVAMEWSQRRRFRLALPECASRPISS